MTVPTPDANGNIAPGYYHAEGDPAGLVRYWDGTQWTGGPIPPPAGGGITVGMPKVAEIGVRMAAITLDGILFFITTIALSIPFAENTNNTDDLDFSYRVEGIEVYFGPLVYLLLTVVLVANAGGSPGKLMLGLRVTGADGTSPPGWGPAILRALPWAATLIPLLGIVIWFGVVIGGIILIANDPRGRSVNDRLGNTYVIRK